MIASPSYDDFSATQALAALANGVSALDCQYRFSPWPVPLEWTSVPGAFSDARWSAQLCASVERVSLHVRAASLTSERALFCELRALLSSVVRPAADAADVVAAAAVELLAVVAGTTTAVEEEEEEELEGLGVTTTAELVVVVVTTGTADVVGAADDEGTTTELLRAARLVVAAAVEVGTTAVLEYVAVGRWPETSEGPQAHGEPEPEGRWCPWYPLYPGGQATAVLTNTLPVRRKAARAAPMDDCIVVMVAERESVGKRVTGLLKEGQESD